VLRNSSEVEGKGKEEPLPSFSHLVLRDISPIEGQFFAASKQRGGGRGKKREEGIEFVSSIFLAVRAKRRSIATVQEGKKKRKKKGGRE